MPEAVIVSAVRTPIGAHGGALAAVRPDDLAARVIAEAVRLAGVDASILEEVYLGCANQAGEDNRNVARMAALLAGLPVEVAAVTFNRLCASGLQAVNAAHRAIKAGEGQAYVAGGVESMSRAPYALPKPEPAYPWGDLTAWDTTLGWRFPNPRLKELVGNESMGETAENVYELTRDISRQDQDAFAFESHRRAVAAIDSGTLRRGDRPGARSPTQGRCGCGRHRRTAAPRYIPGSAGQASACFPLRRHGDGRQLLRDQRRGGRPGAPQRRTGRRHRRASDGAGGGFGRRRRRPAHDGPGPHPGHP